MEVKFYLDYKNIWTAEQEMEWTVANHPLHHLCAVIPWSYTSFGQWSSGTSEPVSWNICQGLWRTSIDHSTTSDIRRNPVFFTQFFR